MRCIIMTTTVTRGRVPYTSTLQCLRKLLREGGIGTWFKGLETKIVLIVLMTAFMFVAYEKIVQVRRLRNRCMLTHHRPSSASCALRRQTPSPGSLLAFWRKIARSP